MQIYGLLFKNLDKLANKNVTSNSKEVDTAQNEETKTNNKTQNSEKFNDVRAEMDKNVPDCTSTIEEKELAISYINRMLACDDIRDDLKNYWQNKKEIIEQEIQNIKNENAISKSGNSERANNVMSEFSKFVDKYFTSSDKKKLQPDDKFEYKITYYNTYISYCKRILACSDITDEQKTNYLQMVQYALRDLANWQEMQDNYLA